MTKERTSRRIGTIILTIAAIASPARTWSPALAQESAAEQGAPDAQERPNVLVIVTDDQRDDEASRTVMPVLERFPLRFTRAYATTPLCCPSRASIFSGRYAHNHGITINLGEGFDHDDTMQATLSRAGYRTAIVGKYLNGITTAPHFDRAHVLRPEKRFYGSQFYVNGKPRRIRGYMTTYIRKTSLRIMEDFSDKDDPWFMYVAPYAPHVPATPERRYANAPVPRFTIPDQDLGGKPRYVSGMSKEMSEIAAFRAKQLRSLMSVNDLVTALLDRLQSLGEDNTIVMFLSDNGYMWGEHRLLSKRYPYEPSVRIPMYMKWDGHVSAGVNENLVANIDVAPTVLAATGIQPTYTLDGRSLFTSNRDRLLLEYWAEGFGIPTWAATLRQGSIFISYETGDLEFYDLVRDPGEMKNLLADPDRVTLAERRSMKADVMADSACAGATCP